LAPERKSHDFRYEIRKNLTPRTVTRRSGAALFDDGQLT